MVPGPHRRPDDVDPQVLAACREMVEQTIATHVLAAGGAPPPTPVGDSWARLPGIAAPVLGIAGELDSDDHVAMVRRVVDAVPNGRFATVAGSAHYPNMERPAEFTALLLGFLRETEAPRRGASLPPPPAART
jgi:pimeloyl-ACP methyl ester carboxylesterase